MLTHLFKLIWNKKKQNALLITENGGVLVTTPKSDPLKNKVSTVTNILLDASGAGESRTKISGTGSFRESIENAINEKEKRNNTLLK